MKGGVIEIRKFLEEGGELIKLKYKATSS